MGQTNWTSLGAPGGVPANLFQPPYAIQNADGRLEVFLVSSNTALWHIWQQTPGKAWSTWASRDNPYRMNSSLFAARHADGRIEFFTLGPATEGSGEVLWHSLRTTPGGNWGSWFSLGSPSAPVGLNDLLGVESNPDGRLEVFAAGSDDALWHIWQLTPNGLWSSWNSLGTPPNTVFGNPASSITNADGRIEIFTSGTDRNRWHIWQIAPGGSWSSWNSLGAPGSGRSEQILTVSRNADGRLEVFTPDDDGLLYHIWQQTPGGSWGDWNSLDQPPSVRIFNPCVAQNKDGRLEVLVISPNGALWHIWQQTPGGSWGTWQSLGTPPGASADYFSLCVIANADGRLEAFATASPTTAPADPESDLWHTWQVTPGGEWGS
jgi:hypothetical protein